MSSILKRNFYLWTKEVIRYISLLLAIISGQHTTFSESLELFKRQCHIRDATWDTVLHYLLSDSMFFSGGPALQQGVGVGKSLSPCLLLALPWWTVGNEALPPAATACPLLSWWKPEPVLSQKRTFTTQKGKRKAKIELLPWAGCAGRTVWMWGCVSDQPPC